MADLKISQLTGASTPLAGTEVLPIVQSGSTVKVSVANLTAGRAISATQLTLTTGNLVIGTSGKGIDFSATAGTGTSELLSDYEEGEWTPVASGTWTTTPIIFGTARYTKIGRQVTLTFAFAAGALAVNTNGYFTGLPFTPVDVGTAAIVDNNIVNRGLAEATGASRVWVTNTSFPDINFVSITYFV